MKKLRILLRCLAAGHKTVFETTTGMYISTQCRGTSLVPNSAEERTIESRLQFELYGEYPLSQNNQTDWDTATSKAFKL